MSPIGICFAPSMREASYSHASRTSSSVNVSPRSCSDLTCPGEISKSIIQSLHVETGRAPSETRQAASLLLCATRAQIGRTCQRRETRKCSHRPKRAGSNSRGTHVCGRNAMPQRQTKADREINNQQAKKQALAQTARVERQAGQQKYPHHVGCGRPIVVR